MFIMYTTTTEHKMQYTLKITYKDGTVGHLDLTDSTPWMRSKLTKMWKNEKHVESVELYSHPLIKA
tara:strand:+ start:895 stop:1092 length:198 start_codon:yes stop_codon:yes gene_type:complete